jgi:hypothetical protein
MGLVKEHTCSVCQRPFVWKIARPSDGYWDRWRNDDGNILASWFLTNNLCWDHAFEKMPKEFRAIIRTEYYRERAEELAERS